MKDAFYFPHDSNAQNDEKILMLREKWKWEGYGLYWAIIERLRDAKDYRFSSQAKAGLALGLSIPYDTAEAFIHTCCELGLLIEKDGFLWSPSLSRRMEEIDLKRERLSSAGKKGAQAKARLKPPLSSKGKEKKGKEKKEDTDTSPQSGDLSANQASPEKLMELWNTKAHPNLPKLKLLTDSRKRHIKARLVDHPEKQFWVDLLERVNQSKFLRGEVNGNGHIAWRADFDWILNPTNLAKILEGNYDNR